MKFKNSFYLPSGRIFLFETDDNYLIESTEMRDVSVGGKDHYEVRSTENPHIIWKHLVDYKKKWLLTVSTQKGCSYKCKFCDVANLPFKGNLSQKEIEYQIRNILEYTPYVKKSDKVKIGFARMGEPTLNLRNVLNSMRNLYNISKSMNRDFIWLPCFNSILPRKIENCIDEIIELKEEFFDGVLHFQISCNSTDENKRKELFGGADVLTIDEIISRINNKKISKRTITLNFIVMKGIEIDVSKLKKMGLGDKFTVKLIPLNKTENSMVHNLETYANYTNYEDLLKLKEDFEKENIPVVADAIAKCEEAGLCCGQLAQIYQ